jgi:hypothetical protein
MEKMEEAMKAMQQGQEYVHDKVTKHEEVLQGARAPTTMSRAHEATTPSRPPASDGWHTALLVSIITR